MKLSIIIVSYNVKDLLSICISSVKRFLPEVEIIVVDNNSSDGSVEMLYDKNPEVVIIANKENAGFSAANNQGILIASGDFILLLNPDTEFKDSSINNLLNYLDQHREVSILAPRLINSDRSLQISCWKFPTVWSIVAETFFLNKIFRLNEYPKESFEKVFKVDFASGAALLFRKELTKKIGLLDTNLFWMDDVDYCYRARTIGEVIYCPDMEVIHHINKNPKRNYKIVISNQLISKLKFFKKHSGSGIALFASLFILIQIILRMFGFLILSIFKQEYQQKLVAYIYSLKKFFKYILFNDHSLT